MRLHEVFSSGKAAVGGWCVIPSPFAAELMGLAGFDWVCIDMQHGLVGYDALVPMLQALDKTGTPAFVRVPWNQPDHIMKALDAGANGVIVPMVNSVEQARAAAGACRYPPDGYRSWGPIRAAFAKDGFEPGWANRDVFCAVMIETAEALERVDDILSVPGIDAVYVGPNDLAVSNGWPPDGNVTRPEHAELVLKIRDACQRHNLIAGIHCGSIDAAKRWRQEGFRMLNVNSDAVFLRTNAMAVIRGLGETPEPEPATSSYA